MKILMTICLITSGFANVMDPVEFEKRLPNVVFGKESWGKKDTAELDPLSLSPYFRASENFVKKCFEDGDKDLLSLAIAAGRFGENTEFFQLLYNMESLFGSSSFMNRNSRGLVHRKDTTNQVGSRASHEPDVESDEEENSLPIPIFDHSESSDEEDENNSSHESVVEENKLSPINIKDINQNEIEETEAYKIASSNNWNEENKNKLQEIYSKNKDIVLKAMLLNQRAPGNVRNSLEEVALFEELFGDEFVKAYIESIVISTMDENPLRAVTVFGSKSSDIAKNLGNIDFKTWSYKVLYPLKFLYNHDLLKGYEINEDIEKDSMQQALLAIENGREFYEKQKTITEKLNEMAKNLIRNIIKEKGYTEANVIRKLEKYLPKGVEKDEK